MNIDKFRVAANITSKLIFQRIIIPKFMKIRHLFHVNNVCRNVKTKHVKNGVWIFWSQLLSSYASYILPFCNRNHHTEFEIERTILTYLN